MSDTAVGALDVVALVPGIENYGLLGGGLVWGGISPFARVCLDKTLGPAVGARCIGASAFVLDAMPLEQSPPPA